MKIKVNAITGYDDAIVAMFISKRSWTPELDREIRITCRKVLDIDGRIREDADPELVEKFNKWMDIALRMGTRHITVIRYINISLMTEGMHRGGQDDIDAHSMRFNNRIIRSSTRLARFDQDEFSDFYKDKVMTTDRALKILNIDIPESFEYEGSVYVKSPNGYVKEEYKEDNDVKRGLYMLGIPSNFVSQINLCEYAHVFQERNKDGGANPEVKEWAESFAQQLTDFCPFITRDYLLKVKN